MYDMIPVTRVSEIMSCPIVNEVSISKGTEIVSKGLLSKEIMTFICLQGKKLLSSPSFIIVIHSSLMDELDDYEAIEGSSKGKLNGPCMENELCWKDKRYGNKFLEDFKTQIGPDPVPKWQSR
ncbi:hypothetical protein GQ457_08G027040 [Hibiscus cannabinus]